RTRPSRLGCECRSTARRSPRFVHELGFGVAPGFQTFVATQEQRVGVRPTP
ncbi:unnamed protein product, partial [Tetraodon nigroviridis]